MRVVRFKIDFADLLELAPTLWAEGWVIETRPLRGTSHRIEVIIRRCQAPAPMPVDVTRAIADAFPTLPLRDAARIAYAEPED